jgi:hypothetical protein
MSLTKISTKEADKMKANPTTSQEQSRCRAELAAPDRDEATRDIRSFKRTPGRALRRWPLDIGPFFSLEDRATSRTRILDAWINGEEVPSLLRHQAEEWKAALDPDRGFEQFIRDEVERRAQVAERQEQARTVFSPLHGPFADTREDRAQRAAILAAWVNQQPVPPSLRAVAAKWKRSFKWEWQWRRCVEYHRAEDAKQARCANSIKRRMRLTNWLLENEVVSRMGVHFATTRHLHFHRVLGVSDDPQVWAEMLPQAMVEAIEPPKPQYYRPAPKPKKSDSDTGQF